MLFFFFSFFIAYELFEMNKIILMQFLTFQKGVHTLYTCGTECIFDICDVLPFIIHRVVCFHRYLFSLLFLTTESSPCLLVLPTTATTKKKKSKKTRLRPMVCKLLTCTIFLNYCELHHATANFVPHVSTPYHILSFLSQ